MKIEDTAFYSKKIGEISRGCKLCVKGEKLVLFVTGLCIRKCFYCPISDKKYGSDVVYADEWETNDIKDIIKEAELISAKGAGITGGDPLCRLERTTDYIKSLKEHFGGHFHIHLYTSFDLVTEESLIKLSDAGLDEIRFHPDISDFKLWSKITLAQKFPWKIGIEIPVIPDKITETKKLIDFFFDKVHFLNLNELEIADNNISTLTKLGYLTKDDLSYAVKDSESSAVELMNYALEKNYSLPIHYCSAKLKDSVQLANRIKRRAKNVKQKFDTLTCEGTLRRGAIYLIKPEFEYKEWLKVSRDTKIEKLLNIKDTLIKKLNIPAEQLYVDLDKLRVLTSRVIINNIKGKVKSMGLVPAMVEEYPTKDCFEVEIDFI